MILGGILLNDGNIICGGLIEPDYIAEIITVYDFWVNLSEEIMGNEYLIDQ